MCTSSLDRSPDVCLPVVLWKRVSVNILPCPYNRAFNFILYPSLPWAYYCILLEACAPPPPHTTHILGELNQSSCSPLILRTYHLPDFISSKNGDTGALTGLRIWSQGKKQNKNPLAYETEGNNNNKKLSTIWKSSQLITYLWKDFLHLWLIPADCFSNFLKGQEYFYEKKGIHLNAN